MPARRAVGFIDGFGSGLPAALSADTAPRSASSDRTCTQLCTRCPSAKNSGSPSTVRSYTGVGGTLTAKICATATGTGLGLSGVPVLPEPLAAPAVDQVIVAVTAPSVPGKAGARTELRVSLGVEGLAARLAVTASRDPPIGDISGVLRVPLSSLLASVPLGREGPDFVEVLLPLRGVPVLPGAVEAGVFLAGDTDEVRGVVVERVVINVMDDVTGRYFGSIMGGSPDFDVELTDTRDATRSVVGGVVHAAGTGLAVRPADELVAAEGDGDRRLGHASMLSPWTSASARVHPARSVHTRWSAVTVSAPASVTMTTSRVSVRVFPDQSTGRQPRRVWTTSPT